mmetsp:Transcript_109535/g.306314  ORF Transcript_109535/g.306314 Transcript_109535/m.306314 type:complete len:245 (+) Transcript_109535:462-1196(+)
MERSHIQERFGHAGKVAHPSFFPPMPCANGVPTASNEVGDEGDASEQLQDVQYRQEGSGDNRVGNALKQVRELHQPCQPDQPEAPHQPHDADRLAEAHPVHREAAPEDDQEKDVDHDHGEVEEEPAPHVVSCDRRQPHLDETIGPLEPDEEAEDHVHDPERRRASADGVDPRQCVEAEGGERQSEQVPTDDDHAQHLPSDAVLRGRLPDATRAASVLPDEVPKVALRWDEAEHRPGAGVAHRRR